MATHPASDAVLQNIPIAAIKTADYSDGLISTEDKANEIQSAVAGQSVPVLPQKGPEDFLQQVLMKEFVFFV